VKYRCVEVHRREYAVSLMCAALRIARSGYYRWRARVPGKRRQANRQLMPSVVQVFEDSGGTYGSPRVQEELAGRGIPCGQNRVAALMRRGGLRARPKPRPRPRIPFDAMNVLNRQFEVRAPDQVWAADVTYIRTGEGFLYLAVVLDVGTRRIVGWSASARLDAELTIAALEMAVRKRQPPPNVLHHSDRGMEYTNRDYRSVLLKNRFQPSYSRPGSCHDNAVTESFFSTLKKERVSRMTYHTRRQARLDLYCYIEAWYNQRRRHSTLGMVSPATYEARFP
jgi:putative transposase